MTTLGEVGAEGAVAVGLSDVGAGLRNVHQTKRPRTGSWPWQTHQRVHERGQQVAEQVGVGVGEPVVQNLVQVDIVVVVIARSEATL